MKGRCRNLVVSRKISLLCLGKFPGTKSFTDKQEGMTIFPYNFFCLSTDFFFVEEPFCVSEGFWYRKTLDKRAGGREYYNFPLKLFCLTVHFVEEHFCVSESFRYRKILWIRVEYHDSLSKICCFTVPKNFVGESFIFSEIWGAKKFMHKKGISLFSVEIFLSRSAEKVFSFKKIP